MHQRSALRRLIYISAIVLALPVQAQQAPAPRPADRALEIGDWGTALDGYRALLEEDPTNGVTWLRIAQAQRGLGQHDAALESLELARDGGGPPAMIDLERARNLAAQGQAADALAALETADHFGLRALSPFEEAVEFEGLRADDRFDRVSQSVRSRIYPCEAMDSAGAFDFWVGSWDVRLADGTRVGQSNVSKRDGGCSVVEDYRGTGGSTGTSVSYFLPSRGQWRLVWVGSAGTLIDMIGGPSDDGIRLEGTIEYANQDLVSAFRGSWTVMEDGAVRQFFEEFSVVGQGWVPWFDGYYVLRAPP